MFPILLVILALYHIAPLAVTDKIAACDVTKLDDYRKGFLDAHNMYRADLANGKMETASGTLDGSLKMFAFNYSCVLESLAAAIATRCPSKPTLDMKVFEYSQNYKLKRRAKIADIDAWETLSPYFEDAVDDWWYSLDDGTLDADVVYKDEKIAQFANIAYDKSTSLGCASVLCKSSKTLATACVYSSIPKIGDKLYTAKKTTNGCNKKPSSCGSGYECIAESEANGGLCQVKAQAEDENHEEEEGAADDPDAMEGASRIQRYLRHISVSHHV